MIFHNSGNNISEPIPNKSFILIPNKSFIRNVSLMAMKGYSVVH